MGSYFRRRLVLILPTVLFTSLVVFLMLYLIPGDPASIYVGENQATPERLAEIRHVMGLDRPWYIRFGDFLWNGIQGDLGRSLQTGRPVTQEIMDRLPKTAELAFAAMATAIVFGVILGVVAALNRNSWIDTASTVISLIGVSVPVFWLGLLLIMVFAVRYQWFPVTSPPGFQGLVLPTVSLALLSTATLARLVRSSMLEVLHREYLTTARAKGLKSRSVIVGHALRNALIPVITVMGLEFGSLLSGAVITETIFARPGLGKLVVDSIQNKDIPVVQGVILVIAVTYIVINLLVDLLYMLIDPRIRFQ